MVGLHLVSQIWAFIFGGEGATGKPSRLSKGMGITRPLAGLTSLAKNRKLRIIQIQLNECWFALLWMDLWWDFAWIKGLLCLILFLCLCFYIKTGNDSCSYEQTVREHKQGPPRHHLSFSRTRIYHCACLIC